MFCKAKNGDKNSSCMCKGVGPHTLLWVFIGLLLVFTIFFVGTIARNNLKKYHYIGKADRMQNTITINGEGKITATPNVAVTELGLVTEKSDVASAQKENTEKMNKLIAEVKQLGIKDEDIQTSNYSIYPKYDYTDGRSVISGYTVNQSATLKIRDLSKISTVLSKVGEVGINTVSSLNFTIDEPENLRAQARDKALVNAKEKAMDLAKNLGVKLVRVISYNEYSPVDSYPKFYAGAAEGMGGGAPTPNIQTGSTDVRMSVSVIYEIE